MSGASLLLLGSTDLTRAIAGQLHAAGVPLGGVMSPPAEFRISYSDTPIQNSRYVDMAGWCRQHAAAFRMYGQPDDIARFGADTGARLVLLAGWHHMVPARVRAAFPGGCVGVHASLLPRYRGGAPLNWALLNGDHEAGVTLFALSDGVDDGPVYDQRRFPIGPDDYIADLIARAETATLEMLAEAVPALLDGWLASRPQSGEPSYSLQREPADGRIDWRRPAAELARLVRSVSRPYPGARTALAGRPLTIWRARVATSAPAVHGAAGQIVRVSELPAPAVITGSGLLLVEEVEGADGFDREAFGRCHQKRLDVG